MLVECDERTTLNPESIDWVKMFSNLIHFRVEIVKSILVLLYLSPVPRVLYLRPASDLGYFSTS